MDRAAFGTLGEAGREAFMDSFLPSAAVVLTRDFGIVEDELRNLYNVAQLEYGVYETLLPEPKQPWKGTLGWEFGKRIALTYGDANPAIAVQASLLATDTFVLCGRVLTDTVAKARS